MKKLLLFISALAVMNVTDAQSLLPTNGDLLPLSEATPAGESVAKRSSAYNPYGKSTGLSDTFYRVNGAQYDSLFTAAAKFYYLGATLPLDSGLVFGINASNWSGYAGRFKFNHLPDTTMKVIGVLAAFGGTYNMATTKTIDFKVWGLDTTSVTVTTTRKMKNRPGTALATLNRSIKNLGINNSGNDTIREHYFTTAASGINTNFFVGYEITYTWPNLGGDTIGAYSCTQGNGWYHGEIQNIVGTDTFINTQTAIKDAGTWKDSYIQMGFNKLNMSIVPIFQYSGAAVWPSMINGVTQNNLTFFGNYPNPATDKVNIGFGLENPTSVSLIIRDITGKTVMNIPATNYAKGNHVISLETNKLAAGNYVYLIRTGDGDAMAAQITIIK